MTRIPPILVVAVFGVLAAVSVMNVRFSSDIYSLLPQDLPEVRGLEQINRFFGRHGQLVVTVQGTSAPAVEEAGMSLAEFLREQEREVAEVHRELSVEELLTDGGELLAWSWLNAEPGEVKGLWHRLRTGRSRESLEQSLAKVTEAISAQDALVTSYDPLGLSQLDGSAAHADRMRAESGLFEVLYVEGRGVDFSDYRAAKKWVDRMRQHVATWQAQRFDADLEDAAVQVGLTGTPAFMAEVGTEMEKDMTVSVGATLILISLLFYLLHRQLRPLSWLLAAMLAVLAVTLALGSLLYGDLSVMSVGFAAILMGLAVDYGIVLYRDALDGGGSARSLRRRVGPGIVWAAATTALVFLSLNLSSLPGLAEMGNLVSLGVLVGALVMLFGFAPVAVNFVRLRPKPRLEQPPAPTNAGRPALIAGLVVPLIAGAALLLGERPALESNFHPFRIRESPAMTAWSELQVALRGHDHAVPTIVTANDLPSLHEELEDLQMRVASAHEEELIRAALLPIAWIPNPDHQKDNEELIEAVLEERERLLSEFDEVGFTEAGAALTKSVFDAWESLLATPAENGVRMPPSGLAAWSIDRVFRRQGDSVAALAAVTPSAPRDRRWVSAICNDQTSVASLPSLGTALNERIRGDLTRVFLPMAAVLAIMLTIVYRSWRDLALSLFCLLFAAAALVILTATSVLEWNSFNICGLPLLFGTGLDFSIHMIFALRRSGGDVRAARRGMGKALFFCGASSAIGFGSLIAASAHGLSSLGSVCAVGILVNMLVAVILLPHWYRALHRRRESPGDKPPVSV